MPAKGNLLGAGFFLSFGLLELVSAEEKKRGHMSQLI
jgi:hypothetical protein